jgi:hypothetical protein
MFRRLISWQFQSTKLSVTAFDSFGIYTKHNAEIVWRHLSTELPIFVGASRPGVLFVIARLSIV